MKNNTKPTTFGRTSTQRNEILRYLETTHSHPTAEDIYEAIKHEIPSISLSTVYRNLAQFEKEGLVIRIQEDNQKARFDANLEYHGHIVCICCDKVSDTQTEKGKQTEITEDGFVILYTKHRYTGICKSCMEKIRKIIEDNKDISKTTQFIKDFSKTMIIIRDANAWISITELATKTNSRRADVKTYAQIGMNLGYIEDDGQERYRFIKSKEEKN